MISVIIPSYNQGQFIEESILSVINQEGSDYELIVVDNLSDDQTHSILDKYKNYISKIIIEADAGQAAAINKGLNVSKGDIVAWINSDDFYEGNNVFNLIENYYHENDEVSFIAGDGYRVDKYGKIQGNFFPKHSFDFDLQALILGLNYLLQPSCFFNNKLIKKHSIKLNEDYHYGLDTDFLIRLAKITNPLVVRDVFSNTREYNNTKTMTGSLRRIDELREIASKYSNREITPGVLCYLFDYIERASMNDPDLGNPSFQGCLVKLWKEVSHIVFKKKNIEPNGFPFSKKKIK